MGEHILVIDEGTTSTRAMLFTADGQCLGSAQQPLTQYYPAPGLVEHDAAEIWTLTLACAREMVALAGGPGKIAGIGITNQRETIVFWDKRTGEPLAPAIVWQDRRTEPFCAELRAAGHEPGVQERTGLLLDPYFSGTKMRWMLDNVRPILLPQIDASHGRVQLGVRASALRTEQRDGDVGLVGRVQLAEISGTDTFVHLDCAGLDLVMQKTGVHVFDIGSSLAVYVHPQDAYVFDAGGALLSAPAHLHQGGR